MAQDPYKYIKSVYDSKIGYENAITDEEKKKHTATANKARQMLRDYGYTDIADSISADCATAEKVKSIMDLYGKKNKTATRDYMYSLGKSYGMSQEDVDRLISWDNTTGEVSFGGKKIGAPDSVVDGVSYWNDTSVLDNAFNDYAARSGLTKTDQNLQGQHNTEIQGNVNQLLGTQNADHNEMNALWKREYEDLKNTNPFTTEEAKAILAKFDLAGLQGRDNAAAESAGTNGGNIDSFAAANALRQQAALVGQGQQVVLDAHQRKLDHAKALLEGMGVYQQNSYTGMQNTIGLQQNESQRLFENQETARLNDGNLKMNDAQIKSMGVDDKVKIAGVSGYTPDEWVASDNPYMNDDGTLKAQYLTKEFDDAGGFTAIMEKAKEAGNTDGYNAAATARFYKFMSDYGKYGQYDDGNYIVPTRQKTQAAIEHDDEKEVSMHEINTVAESNKYNTDANMMISSNEIAAEERMAAEDRRSAEAMLGAELGSKEYIAAMDNDTKLQTTAMDNDTKLQTTVMNNNTKLQTTAMNNESKQSKIAFVTLPESLAEDSRIINPEDDGKHSTVNGVDTFGIRLLNAVDERFPGGGALQDVVAYAVSNSAKHHVNKQQLNHVLNYLGVSPSDVSEIMGMLVDRDEQFSWKNEADGIPNPVSWANGVDWKDGKVWKANTK